MLFQAMIVLALSLGLLLFITARGLGPMSQGETIVRYAALLAQDAPAARLVQTIMGDGPPQWAMGLCVVWERANVAGFWWVPLVLALIVWLVGRAARRRRGP
ncbi:hypothetical protein Deba_1423 [Desulfarculus baarsii DSM 2075]|uniref:Uncharacterized protein n=1 Tax=Desulfarculus baarsii (strain ATCC 33931 / DSM 2075 / LMG 7858 / VKM B-1802 / 2st14) TaxID=644282 RepID=E1QGU8_DESB2|nr:hypothetical protein Deba_1423 [Desulfarculus baarsii DSM 2075]